MADRRISAGAQQAQLPTHHLWRLLSLLLLFLLLGTTASAVARAMRGPVWSPLLQSALLGMLIGALVRGLKIPVRHAVFPGALCGALFVLVVAGGLAGHIGEALHELDLLAGTLISTGDLTALDASHLAERLAQLAGAVQVVLGRLSAWLAGWWGAEPAFDPVATTLVWAWLVMLASAWGGWWVVAGRPILAALPAMSTAAAVLAATGTRYGGLYLLLGTSLMLVASVRQAERQQDWERARVGFPVGIGGQIATRAMLITTGIVIVSGLTSSLSLSHITDWLRRDPQPGSTGSDGVASSLGLRQQPASEDPLAEVRSPGLPREHLIGAGPELSEQEVMRVSVEGIAQAGRSGTPPALYWRGLTYDVYTGRGWRSSGTTEERYPPQAYADDTVSPYAVQIGQRFELVGRAGPVLVMAGEPISVDRRYAVLRRAPQDVFAVTADVQRAYSAVSWVPSADEAVLRGAGQDYPERVRDRFLQLPAGLPGRVRSLALELTATEGTAYDRALAIESYLRTFPYTLEVDRPRRHRDVVDFFLYEEQRGYCDYYASAMVVLARAGGIPARLATGFASGTYSPAEGAFVVTEAQAHSWAEVFFPGVGWVSFEPTAALPVLDRGQIHRQEQVLELRDSSAFFEASSPNGSGGRVPIVLAIALGLPALVVGGLAADDLRLRRLENGAASVEIHRRLRRLAKRLKVRLEPGATPKAVGLELQISFGQAGNRSSRLYKIARSIRRDTAQLTTWISAVQFEPESPDKAARWEAIRAWRRLWLAGHMWLLIRALGGGRSGITSRGRRGRTAP